tara:strand:- start:2464 stop:2655 length:192 start_codon:yes stop_codon:yes gene_type:complete
MTYTVIFKDAKGMMGTLTFVSSRHCKNFAWGEYNDKHAKDGHAPVAIMPGNQVVYFPHDISFA